MNRRQMIVGLGTVSFGFTSALGTGAFSQMASGERSVTVDVVDDSEALVGLKPSEYYESTFLDDEGKLTVSLGGSSGAPGVNPRSAYRVGMVENKPLKNREAPAAVLPSDDGSPTDDPAFSIANQSNQSQDINIHFGSMSGSGKIKLYFQFAPSSETSGSAQTFDVTPATDKRDYTFDGIPAGEFVAVSFIIDATDAEMDDNVAFSMTVSAY